MERKNPYSLGHCVAKNATMFTDLLKIILLTNLLLDPDK